MISCDLLLCELELNVFIDAKYDNNYNFGINIKEGKYNMSKARARERAKLRRGKKRVSKLDIPAERFSPGQFRTEPRTIKSPRVNNVKNLSVNKRGANRSG